MEKKKQKRKLSKRVLLPLFLLIGAFSSFSLATVKTLAFDGYPDDIEQTRGQEYWNALNGCELYVSNDSMTYTVPVPNSVYANTSGRVYTYNPSAYVTIGMDAKYYEDYKYQYLDIDVNTTSDFLCTRIEYNNNNFQIVPWNYFIRQLNNMNINFAQSGWSYVISFQAYNFETYKFENAYIENGSVENFYNPSRLTLENISEEQRNVSHEKGTVYGIVKYLQIAFYNTNGQAVDSTFSLRFDNDTDIRNYQYVRLTDDIAFGPIYKDSLGVFDFVEEFFNFEIFPNFRMSTMLAIGLGVMALSIFLKLAFGG